jgi:hypothetical protein
MTRRTAAFLREEAVRQAAFALAAKRETNTLRAVLADVRLYAEQLKRSPERGAQRIGMDLMGLLASHEEK